MGIILDFPTLDFERQSLRHTHRALEHSPAKLVALPNDRILLAIQNALEEAQLTRDWHASKRKIECAIRQANLSIVHSGN